MSASFAANLNRLLHGYRIAEQIVAGRESVIEYTSITKMEHSGGTRLIEAAPKYKGICFPLKWSIPFTR
jgi:hypothetical protein